MLFAEEDRRAFFLGGGVLDIGAPIAVSVVCIRAGASPLPHYVAKLWANGPPGEPKGTTDAVKVEMEVTSSKDPALLWLWCRPGGYSSDSTPSLGTPICCGKWPKK